MIIKSITKTYPSFSKTLIYDQALVFQVPICESHSAKSCQICWPRGSSDQLDPSSLQRTKTLISDYVLANKFDLFCTFTYDPEKVDSFNVEHAKRVFSKWLNNQRRLSPDFKYLAVAEYHKSGRIHFHALFENYTGDLFKTDKKKNNRVVYNLSNWRFGWSTAIKISTKNNGYEKVASYVKKYITKDMIFQSNKKRFFSSRNLKKPIKSYNNHHLHNDYPFFVESKDRFEYITLIKSHLPANFFSDTLD